VRSSPDRIARPQTRPERRSGVGASGPRCDAARPLRQFEKRIAGVPFGGGDDSPTTFVVPGCASWFSPACELFKPEPAAW